MESDLRLLVKLIHHFDKKSCLWSYSVANNSNEVSVTNNSNDGSVTNNSNDGSVTNNSNEENGEEMEQEKGETEAPKVKN